MPQRFLRSKFEIEVAQMGVRIKTPQVGVQQLHECSFGFVRSSVFLEIDTSSYVVFPVVGIVSGNHKLQFEEGSRAFGDNCLCPIRKRLLFFVPKLLIGFPEASVTQFQGRQSKQGLRMS